MGPTWGREDAGEPHGGPIDLIIWAYKLLQWIFIWFVSLRLNMYADFVVFTEKFPAFPALLRLFMLSLC